MNRIFVALLMVLTLAAGAPAIAGEKDNSPACKAEQCCVTNCSDCAKTCEDILAYCKTKGGKHADAKHIKIMQDCITLCKACSDLDKRKSEYAARVHAICAEACKKCAESCESLNDKKLKDCVEQCKKCSASCSEASKKQ